MEKIDHLSSYAHVVHTTAKQIIHVVERTKTSSKCQKMKKARAKRAKIMFFIVKYANLRGLLLPSSSWLLKLPMREFMKLRRLLQQKRHTKIELCVRLGSMLVTLHKLGEVHFRSFGTNGFYVKKENERFTAEGSRCRQNL